MGYNHIRFGSLNPEERWLVFSASQMTLCSNAGLEARRWLLEGRGLDVQTLADFRLGYVPFDSGHAFAGRIVIPIFDTYSNLIALSVRPATNDQAVLDEYKKYWNESYEKGWNLFGMNLARMSIVRMGFAILVEGQFDVASMHCFGFTNTVGVLGGGFTPMHAELLAKWTNQLIIMFDGDKAGREHAERCESILSYYGWVERESLRKEQNKKLFVSSKVSLPYNKDPNEYLQRYGSYSMQIEIMKSMNAANMILPKDWTK